MSFVNRAMVGKLAGSEKAGRDGAECPCDTANCEAVFFLQFTNFQGIK